MIIHAFTIDLLNAQRGLIHAVSPRYFERENGAKAELDFGTLKEDSVLSLPGREFLRSIGIENKEVYRVRQVHGNHVHELKEPTSSLEKSADIDADAIITQLVNKPIAVLTADCIPVVIYDSRLHAAGVVHAGRRGTAQKILSKTIGILKKVYGSRPEDVFVGMGPGIGGCCYEVGASCIEPFKKGYAGWSRWAKKLPSGKFTLDLFAANTEDARMAGLDPGHISQTGWCSSCEIERFFSYRRDGTSGRMMTVAMLSPL